MELAWNLKGGNGDGTGPSALMSSSGVEVEGCTLMPSSSAVGETARPARAISAMLGPVAEVGVGRPARLLGSVLVIGGSLGCEGALETTMGGAGGVALFISMVDRAGAASRFDGGWPFSPSFEAGDVVQGYA